jgi:transcriptional regulator GlxA family with amidase domain
MKKRDVKQVEFLLFPGMLALDITGPLEVFNTATLILKNSGRSGAGYEYTFTAEKTGPVPTSSGLSFMADHSFTGDSSPDIFLVPGGDLSLKDRVHSRLLAYVGDAAGRSGRTVSVCKGAFLLAEAGVLKGKKATTHWLEADALSCDYPEVDVNAEAIFLKDGRVYTSAGVTSGIDLALALVEEDFGAAVALEVSRYLVLYYKRPGLQSQFSSPLVNQAAAGETFRKLFAWLSENLERNVTVEEMAEHAAMSPRNFVRSFKKETGQGPGKFFENMKLDRAREMIISGASTLEEVAEQSGFGREERLRRAFLRRNGLTPSQYRLHFGE